METTTSTTEQPIVQTTNQPIQTTTVSKQIERTKSTTQRSRNSTTEAIETIKSTTAGQISTSKAPIYFDKLNFEVKKIPLESQISTTKSTTTEMATTQETTDPEIISTTEKINATESQNSTTKNQELEQIYHDNSGQENYLVQQPAFIDKPVVHHHKTEPNHSDWLLQQIKKNFPGEGNNPLILASLVVLLLIVVIFIVYLFCCSINNQGGVPCLKKDEPENNVSFSFEPAVSDNYNQTKSNNQGTTSTYLIPLNAQISKDHNNDSIVKLPNHPHDFISVKKNNLQKNNNNNNNNVDMIEKVENNMDQKYENENTNLLQLRRDRESQKIQLQFERSDIGNSRNLIW